MIITISALTSAVVSAAIILAVRVGGDLSAGEPSAVPDVTGMTPTGAGALIRQQGLRLLVDGETHHPEIPEGQICQQEPRPGSQVPPGTEIHVHTSLGPEPVLIPRLAGQPLDAARAALRQAGLEVGEVTVEEGPGEPNTVVRSSPVAGERVEPASSVDLVARPATRMVTVPELVGENIRRAREMVEEAGLTISRERRRFDDLRPPYRVLDQDPEPGTEVEAGAGIELTVNEE